MYERPHVTVKVERGSTFTSKHELSLFYLRSYARKNVGIHFKGYGPAVAEPMSNLKAMGRGGAMKNVC